MLGHGILDRAGRMRSLHGVDVVTVHELPQQSHLPGSDLKRAVGLPFRNEDLVRGHGIETMLAQQRIALRLHGDPVRGLRFLARFAPSMVVIAQSRRAELRDQRGRRRQGEVPYRQGDRNLADAAVSGGNSIRAAIVARRRVGRNVDIDPEAVCFLGGQIERHGGDASPCQLLPGHRVLKRDERVGIPVRLEAVVSVRAHVEVKLMLAIKPGVCPMERRPARPLQVARFDPDAADRHVRP